jgi:hypothetical protein
MALAMLALNLPRSGLVQHIIGADNVRDFGVELIDYRLPLNSAVGKTKALPGLIF